MIAGRVTLHGPTIACEIGWSCRGVSRVRFVEPNGEEPIPTPALPRAIADAVRRLRAHLSGDLDDLLDVELDLSSVPDFDRDVYAACRRIRPGRTTTYGLLARELGEVRLAQRVGQALGRNPVPLLVPCHRVLARDGAAGGFSAPGGLATKFKLLALESAEPAEAPPSLFDTLPLAVAPSRR